MHIEKIEEIIAYTIRKNIITHHIGAIIWQIKNILLYGLAEPIVWYVNKEKKLVYMQTPKAACSSITANMYDMEETDAHIVHRKAFYGRDKRLLLPIWMRAQSNNKYKNYFKFTFVRNPFERLVSCYKNKYHTDKKYIGSTLTHMTFDIYMLGYLKKDEGFCEFAKKMSKIPQVLANAHFASQAYRIFDKDGVSRLDFVGKLENISNDWNVLVEKCGFTPLCRLNQTGRDNWMDYYDRKTAEIVYKYYEKDVKAFGYEDSYGELMDYISKKEVRKTII